MYSVHLPSSNIGPLLTGDWGCVPCGLVADLLLLIVVLVAGADHLLVRVLWQHTNTHGQDNLSEHQHRLGTTINGIQWTQPASNLSRPPSKQAGAAMAVVTCYFVSTWLTCNIVAGPVIPYSCARHRDMGKAKHGLKLTNPATHGCPLTIYRSIGTCAGSISTLQPCQTSALLLLRLTLSIQ